MTWLKCLNINKNTALVRSNKTGKSFPVKISQDIRYLIDRGDHLKVIKSPVSKEWIAIDYNKYRGVCAYDR